MRWQQTEPSKHERSNQCWLNAGPLSLMLAQHNHHWRNISCFLGMNYSLSLNPSHLTWWIRNERLQNICCRLADRIMFNCYLVRQIPAFSSIFKQTVRNTLAPWISVVYLFLYIMSWQCSLFLRVKSIGSSPSVSFTLWSSPSVSFSAGDSWLTLWSSPSVSFSAGDTWLTFWSPPSVALMLGTAG